MNQCTCLHDELKLACRLSDTQSNTELVTPSHLPDKNSSGIETQEVHIKLESDHSLASELLRRSLTAVPIQSELMLAIPSLSRGISG